MRTTRFAATVIALTAMAASPAAALQSAFTYEDPAGWELQFYYQVPYSDLAEWRETSAWAGSSGMFRMNFRMAERAGDYVMALLRVPTDLSLLWGPTTRVVLTHRDGSEIESEMILFTDSKLQTRVYDTGSEVVRIDPRRQDLGKSKSGGIVAAVGFPPSSVRLDEVESVRIRHERG